jgi:prevent-host-death family protein
MPSISVANVKSHLSEIIAKSAHGHERFIITRRDKPVAAIVSLDDLKILEQYQERQGLATVASSWPDFEEVAVTVIDLRELRRQGGGGRDVSL